MLCDLPCPPGVQIVPIQAAEEDGEPVGDEIDQSDPVHERPEERQLERNRGSADDVRPEQSDQIVVSGGVLGVLEGPRVVDDVLEDDGQLDGERGGDQIVEARQLDEQPQHYGLDERRTRSDDDEPIETDHRRMLHHVTIAGIAHDGYFKTSSG